MLRDRDAASRGRSTPRSTSWRCGPWPCPCPVISAHDHHHPTTTTVEQALNEYLSVRRALGFKLAENGRLLPDFVAYLEAAGASTVTTELAVAWATQPTGCTPVWWARRLAMVRGFARHLKRHRPGHRGPTFGRAAPPVPPGRPVLVLRRRRRRGRWPRPGRCAARCGRPPTRPSSGSWPSLECAPGRRCCLDRDHLDGDEGVLTVWNSKFQKSRALPLHPTTMKALGSYARLRDELCPHPKAPSFFITTTGTRLGRSFNDGFAGLVAAPASTTAVDGPAHMT